MWNKTPEKLAKKTAWALSLTFLIGLLVISSIVIWRRQGAVAGFGNTNIKLEVVTTPEALAKGLSERDSLGEAKGMLFVFPSSGEHCFWMKDMRFPIDILWLDEQKKVVSLKANVQPETYPESFCPSKKARYVIEVNAGQSSRAGVEPGSQLSF